MGSKIVIICVWVPIKFYSLGSLGSFFDLPLYCRIQHNLESIFRLAFCPPILRNDQIIMSNKVNKMINHTDESMMMNHDRLREHSVSVMMFKTNRFYRLICLSIKF